MTAWPPAALVESVRLANPSAAVDPDVHTPERVAAYLRGLGYRLLAAFETFDVWGDDDIQVIVPLATEREYRHRVGLLATALANEYDTGELGILTAIANQTIKETNHA